MRSQRHLREIQGFDSACRTAYELGERSRWTPQEQYDRARARGCNPPPPPLAGIKLPFRVFPNPPDNPYPTSVFMEVDLDPNGEGDVPQRPNPTKAFVTISGVTTERPVSTQSPGLKWTWNFRFLAPGSYDIHVRFDTGDWGQQTVEMLPRPVEGPPVMVSPPTVTGTPVVGQVLTAVSGVFESHPPLTGNTFYWRINGETGSNSDPTYTLTAADVGDLISVMQVVSNPQGFLQPVSAEVGPVRAT